MMRIRGKALGLGLALAAGPLVAQPPALLPPTVRTGEWSAGGASDAVWFPARAATPRPAPMPAVPTAPLVVAPLPAIPTAPLVVAPPLVAPPPPAVVRPVQAEAEPVTLGPRTGAVSAELGPLPSIPALPDVTAAPQPFPVVADLPPIPTVMPVQPVVQPQPAPPLPQPPLPQPKVEPPPPPPATVPPSDAPPRPQPTPLPAPQSAPPQPELQTAPPELLVPGGYQLPPRHTAFGSDPVSISRDYPTLHDLFRIRHDRADGVDGTDDPGAGPAADRGYVRLEYLMWWVNPQRIPVLASTSTTGGLGFLGEPGTAALLGPGRYGDQFRSGFRVRGGWWCDDDGHVGVDGSFFFLGRNTTSTTFDSADTPTITRPFFAANDGGFEFGERVSRPGFARGTLAVDATSSLYGFDANLRHALCRTCGFRSEVFVGYRALALNESLTVTEYITALNTADPAGTRIVVQDQFTTTNRFHGGQLGYAAERNWGRVSLDGRASVALGNTHQTVEVTGFQQKQRPGEAAVLFPNGGLLAAGPNLGRFTDDRFSVVPEVSLNLGYWLTPGVKFYVGYNALYWSNVARPGDQVDRTIDVTFIPNPPVNPATGQVPAFSGMNRPVVPFRQDHLWVNGIQLGAEWRW
jgi:hypothetical protein